MISPLTFRRGGSVCCVAVCALLAMIYPATGVPIDRVADHANTLDPSSPPLTKGGRGIFPFGLSKLTKKQIPLDPPFSKGDADATAVR